MSRLFDEQDRKESGLEFLKKIIHPSEEFSVDSNFRDMGIPDWTPTTPDVESGFSDDQSGQFAQSHKSSPISGSTFSPWWPLCHGPCRWIVVLLVGVASLIVVNKLRNSWGPTSLSNDAIQLSGKSVAQLQPGADVVWGDVTIGRVKQVQTHGLNPKAELEILPQFRARLPRSAKMEVGSLNPILPGNIGVRILAEIDPQQSLFNEQVQAQPRLLPARTPLGFWIVIAMAALTAFMGMAVYFKAVCMRLFWKAIAAFILTLAIHLCTRSIVNLDFIKQWSENVQQVLEKKTDEIQKSLPKSGKR